MSNDKTVSEKLSTHCRPNMHTRGSANAASRHYSRISYKLLRPDRRDEVLSALSNAIQFDPRCMTELSKKPKVNELYSRLKDMGAGESAYIFSRSKELHGQTLPLRDALEQMIGQTCGTLVYCFEGQVGYYEADGLERYFLIHRAS